MVKKLCALTYTFILFLFEFTLIMESPVFALDSPDFVACDQMKWEVGKKIKDAVFS